MSVILPLIALVLLAIGLVWFMVRASKRRVLSVGAKRAIERAWQRVMTQTNPALKIIEADKTLDEVLRLLGFTGSLGEKLQVAGPRFSDLNGLWSAHKLRNRVVHDLSSALSEAEAARAIGIFKRALTDLGARLYDGHMKPAFLLVGLGNPGKQYERTRHNAGWLALDTVAKDFGAGKFIDRQKFLCSAAEGEIDGVAVLFVKPTTYMNMSGQCIKKFIDFYKLDPATQMLVVCDDIDLPLGSHRFRLSGGPGTHNGLKSIVEVFGEDFPRHRIGLGSHPEDMDLAAWVLSRMTEDDLEVMKPAFAAVTDSVKQVMKTAKK